MKCVMLFRRWQWLWGSPHRAEGKTWLMAVRQKAETWAVGMARAKTLSGDEWVGLMGQ